MIYHSRASSGILWNFANFTFIGMRAHTLWAWVISLTNYSYVFSVCGGALFSYRFRNRVLFKPIIWFQFSASNQLQGLYYVGLSNCFDFSFLSRFYQVIERKILKTSHFTRIGAQSLWAWFINWPTIIWFFVGVEALFSYDYFGSWQFGFQSNYWVHSMWA